MDYKAQTLLTWMQQALGSNEGQFIPIVEQVQIVVNTHPMSGTNFDRSNKAPISGALILILYKTVAGVSEWYVVIEIIKTAALDWCWFIDSRRTS